MLHSSADEKELRRRARAALLAEVLPRAPPLRSWGGRGSGELCPVCGHPIEPEQLELEVEFAEDDRINAAREFHLHLPCFAAWEAVRTLTSDTVP